MEVSRGILNFSGAAVHVSALTYINWESHLENKNNFFHFIDENSKSFFLLLQLLWSKACLKMRHLWY